MHAVCYSSTLSTYSLLTCIASITYNRDIVSAVSYTFYKGVSNSYTACSASGRGRGFIDNSGEEVRSKGS